VQAKIEALLAKAFPDTQLGNLRVRVEEGRTHGNPQAEKDAVAHDIFSFTPNVGTAELPPAAVEVGAAGGGGDAKARPVVQKSTLAATTPPQLHWRALQGDYDRAWKVTFIGGMGNMPQLQWPGGVGEDAADGPPALARRAHVGGLTAVGAHVTTATLRQV
jgi:hypothetical protein